MVATTLQNDVSNLREMFKQTVHVQLAQHARVSCIMSAAHIRGSMTLTNITKLPMMVTAVDGMLCSPSSASGTHKLSYQETAGSSSSTQCRGSTAATALQYSSTVLQAAYG